jgi:plastocyanin
MGFLPGTLWINVGDTVVWTVKAAEVHTVTFLAAGQSLPTFNPGDPSELFPVGGTHYDGHSYYNSGLLSDMGAASGFPAGTTYQLTFDVAGDFTYYCLVHGAMMQALLHVRPAGTHYPYTQHRYDQQIASGRAAVIRDGRALLKQTEADATNHLSFAGADDGFAMVMRWIKSDLTVHVGDTITFVNTGMAAPHTVTFGPEPANVFVPSGDPTDFTGQPINSGLFLPGSTYKVTFMKAGTFDFYCALHDYMGMVGVVHVLDH